MSAASRRKLRLGQPEPVVRSVGRGIGPGAALMTWFAAWVAASVVGVVVTSAAGASDSTSVPISVVAISLVLGWAVYLTAMALVSQRAGSDSFVVDYGLRVRPIDAAGLSVGVLCQLVVVPLVYLPLRAVWPTTFGDDRLRDNATSLVDRADDPATMVLLAGLLVLGAPVVEELVYRGLVQRSLAGRISQLVAWLATAALFTLIHFRPVEYPGLAAFALIVGASAAVTRRLGPAIAIHVGFNATGLFLATR